MPVIGRARRASAHTTRVSVAIETRLPSGWRTLCRECLRANIFSLQVVKSIDMTLPLYGGVAPLSIHICCCTGRTDWKHTIEDEEGSDAHRIGRSLQSYETALQGRDRIVLSNVSIETQDKSKDYTGTE